MTSFENEAVMKHENCQSSGWEPPTARVGISGAALWLLPCKLRRTADCVWEGGVRRGIIRSPTNSHTVSDSSEQLGTTNPLPQRIHRVPQDSCGLEKPATWFPTCCESLRASYWVNSGVRDFIFTMGLFGRPLFTYLLRTVL